MTAVRKKTKAYRGKKKKPEAKKAHFFLLKLPLQVELKKRAPMSPLMLIQVETQFKMLSSVSRARPRQQTVAECTLCGNFSWVDSREPVARSGHQLPSRRSLPIGCVV